MNRDERYTQVDERALNPHLTGDSRRARNGNPRPETGDKNAAHMGPARRQVHTSHEAPSRGRRLSLRESPAAVGIRRWSAAIVDAHPLRHGVREPGSKTQVDAVVDASRVVARCAAESDSTGA